MNWTYIQKGTFVFILLLQISLIIIFGFKVKYNKSADPRTSDIISANVTDLDVRYPMFQDIHVMIFVGFGFLMTFLKKYAYSALGFTFFVSALVIQIAIILKGLLYMEKPEEWIMIDIDSLIDGDVAAATFLISFGAILGKTSPLQLVLMAIIETVLYSVNEYINVKLLETVDAGGSVFVHTFGAYFGLAISFVLGHQISSEGEENELEESTYQSDITSMIGTLFLWLFWPSFNAGLLHGDQKYRAIINTYLALLASCVTTFLMSSVIHKENKFEMVHIQNATLAGGVCVGTSANMMIRPFGALIIGCFAGVLSTIGFAFIQGFFKKKLRIHDTCGVNNLHGMPGISAGLIGVIATACASKSDYGEKLYEVFFPTAFNKRSLTIQSLYQLASIGVTLAIAITGGLLTGVLLWKACSKCSPEEYYNDEMWWEMNEKPEA